MSPEPKSKREWPQAFLVLLFLFVVWLVVEIIAIRTLGTNTQNTFHHVPAQPPTASPVEGAR